MISKILLFSLVQNTISWRCGVDDNPIKPQKHSPKYRGLNVQKQTSLKGLRIVYDYSDQLKEWQIYLEAAQDFFGSSLLVNRYINNLTFEGFDTCGEAEITNQHQTTGVEGQILIYVLSYSSNDGVLASAGACQIDQADNRPTAGQLKVNTYYWNQLQQNQRISVIIHQITHILGFTQGLYSYYVNQNDQVLGKQNVVTTSNLRGASRSLIILDKVVQKAREAFDCSSLTGLQLENSGGEGTAGSHWDTRVAKNELMVGTVQQDAIISTFTMALLEGTGWYQVDWDYAQTPIFGYDQGCDFINNYCVVDGVAQFDDFCVDSSGQEVCDQNHLRKGSCNLYTYSQDLSSEYQYFSDPKLGGSDSYADYCPYIVGYQNCRDENPGNVTLVDEFDQQICDNCRCFESSLVNDTQTSDMKAACYEVLSCSSGTILIQVGNQNVSCTQGESVTVSGYSGVLVCPEYEIICENFPCLNNCYGRGVCEGGECYCDHGYWGEDCSGGEQVKDQDEDQDQNVDQDQDDDESLDDGTGFKKSGLNLSGFEVLTLLLLQI